MKLFLMILTFLVTPYSWAISADKGINMDVDKWQKLIEATEYSAKFVGYSSYCRANPSDTDFVHNWFFNIVLPKSNLSDSNLKDIKQIYYRMVVKSKTNGPIDSNLNCEIFSSKLKELKNAIKGGKATSSSKQSTALMSEDIRKYIKENKNK